MLRVSGGSKICFVLALYLFGALPTSELFGCRYTVRETGFVDFGIDYYTLSLPLGENDLSSDSRRQVFQDLLINSNIVIASRNPNRYRTALSDSDFAVLFSPRENHPPLELSPGVLPAAQGWKTGGRKSDLSPHIAAVRNAVDSPLRERIVEGTAKHYAVVLFIEGTDPERNRSALHSISRAIEEINDHLDFLPKPVARGPVAIPLGEKEREAEKVLLWSLGMAGSPQQEPSAAVIYGKARWIGPLLRGADITVESVLRILAVIGSDCECGTDPRILRGIPLPVRWGKSVQDQLVWELGFDPENPMVKVEVSQILRLRSRLFSDLSVTYNRSSGVDDLPVPFVEDSVRTETHSSPFRSIQHRREADNAGRE